MKRDRTPVDELLEQFLQASMDYPQKPPRFEQSKPLAEHGSVRARLDSYEGRVSDLEAEWHRLIEEHAKAHHAGVAHLRHLKETIAQLESSPDSDSGWHP